MKALSQADQQEGAKGICERPKVREPDASGKLNRIHPEYLERLTRTVHALALKNCLEQQKLNKSSASVFT